MVGDIANHTAGICPVCLFLAHLSPLPDHSLAIACDRCGEFDFSEAALDVIDNYTGSLDRHRLSEAVGDVCMMAECTRPMIDAITASALIGFATICA